jgi:hypothetical protein
MDIYVYYRVRSEHAPALQTRVCTMQSKLGGRPRLMRRPEIKDGLQTWMEVYVDVPDTFEARLAEAVRSAELNTMIEGERHTERFVAIS